MEQEPLISISEASHILGVSEAALRQWTDEGQIRAFITPGGHRRYSRAELKRFMTSHQKILGIKDLIAELEGTVELHREIARTHLNTTSWYNKLSQESQEHLAELSRGILNLIIRYIAEPSGREGTIKLTHDVGHSFGETLAKLGLSLTDSVEAFIAHRDAVISTTTHLMKKRKRFSGRVVESVPLVAHVMDEALVSMLAAHQQYRNMSTNGAKGGDEA